MRLSEPPSALAPASSSPESIAAALSGLIAWLETWRTQAAAYNGFVIHRVETKRMWAIHDTAWTQAAMIRGYANLARKTGDDRWLDALRAAADLQASRLDRDSGKYQYAGHEDDRYCSLVHCALANCALMAAHDLVDPDRQARYIDIVRRNVDRYWIPSLWVDTEGAFRFSETDYMSLREHRFVINFNCMAIECLLLLAQLTGDLSYRARAIQVGEWLKARCRYTREYLALHLPDTPGDRMPPGGLPYQFTPTNDIPDNCVTLYAGLSLRGIAALYHAAADDEVAQIARDTVGFLLAMRDPATRLFMHTTSKLQIVRYPLFISGAAMVLTGLLAAADIAPSDDPARETLSAILATQYRNGSFPSFIGKNIWRPRPSPCQVWEDAVAAVNWNAQLFEYLTAVIERPASISPPAGCQTIHLSTSRFLYHDTQHAVAICSWSPLRSVGLYLMRKKASRAYIALYPYRRFVALKVAALRLLGRPKATSPAHAPND
jgi:hypothetical protein